MNDEYARYYDGIEDEEDQALAPASTAAYIAAEHRAGIRLANAGRGLAEIARLVDLGTLPEESRTAARDEYETAAALLGAIHQTPVGQDPATGIERVRAAEEITRAEIRARVAEKIAQALESAGTLDGERWQDKAAAIARKVYVRNEGRS